MFKNVHHKIIYLIKKEKEITIKSKYVHLIIFLNDFKRERKKFTIKFFIVNKSYIFIPN